MATGASAGAGSDGSLPFTGLQLALMVALGAGIMGAGLALRRASVSRPVA